MTDSLEPEPAPASSPRATVSISRAALVSAAAGAVIVVVAALIGGIAIGSNLAAGKATRASASGVEIGQPKASHTTGESPKPTPTAAPNTYKIGQAAVSGGITVQLNSVQIVPSVPDTEGGTITADAGAELVYFQGTFTNNTKEAVDLTCSAEQIYATAYATNGDEMSDLFDEDEIAGNPVCNTDLVTGQSHAWNFVYTAPAGATPGTFVFQDTTTYPVGDSTDVTTIDLEPAS